MEKKTMNEVLVRRQNKIICSCGSKKTPLKNGTVMSFVANLMGYGFMPGDDLIDMVKTMNTYELERYANEVIPILRNVVGAHYDYKVMYPKFPQQVMEASEAELFFNAILHYLSDGKWVPDYPARTKTGTLLKVDNYRILHVATEKDYVTLIENLMFSKTPLSVGARDDIWHFLKYYPNSSKHIPDTIPIRENMAYIYSTAVLLGEDIDNFLPKLDTPTDVLRFAIGLSDGDVSLSTNSKFKSMPKKVRRGMLQTLENMSKKSSFEEDMLRYKGMWVRFAEVLHPGEYANRYQNTYRAFQKLRNNKKIATYAGKLESAIAAEDIGKALQLLQSRPGIFARRLDNLLRVSKNPMVVVDSFRQVAEKVPTTILLQVREHFSHRSKKGPSRVFFPKGNVAKAYNRIDVLEALPAEVTEAVVAVCEDTLLKQYSERTAMGKVYISENLKGYNIPTKLRHAAKSLVTVSRGSKFEIPEDCNVLRSFVYWKNGKNRTDVDLSAVVFDKDYSTITTVAYYNLRAKNCGIVHSGDIVDAPEGASEFVDIDLAKAAELGRYVAVTINCFSQQPYCDLPICFGGWMYRGDGQSGEIFEPSTLKHRFDVTGDRITDLVCVVDLHERCIYWADLAFEKSMVGGFRANNVATHVSGITAMVKSIVESHQPSLYDMFYLNAKSRGTIVESPDDADVIFSEDDNATVRPTDTDVIISQYL